MQLNHQLLPPIPTVRSIATFIFLLLSCLICRPVAFVQKFGGRADKLSKGTSRRGVTMDTIDSSMHETYEVLSLKLLSAVEHLKEGDQHWVCLAGGPGAGKSTLSAAVAKRVNELSNHSNFAVVLPMDGFHYSRKQLKEISEKSGSSTFDELLARRGSQWTFDATAICEALTNARELRSGILPTYSRAISDPVPGGVELLKSHKIVIVEGNYMLNYDDPLWTPLKGLFNEKWYISCKSMEDQRNRLIRRHLETWTEEKSRMWGEGELGATKKADSNDVLNAIFIEGSAKHADLMIESL